MIGIDASWLATEPMDMRAGTETALARLIAVFGAAKPHCAYLFVNRRVTRMKVLVHAVVPHVRICAGGQVTAIPTATAHPACKWGNDSMRG